MPFAQIDPMILIAKQFAQAAGNKDIPLDERAVHAATAQAWALIASAQAAENARLVKPSWRQ